MTSGPAWSALTDSIARILRREPHSFGLFFKAFGKYHLRSVLLAALLAVPAVSLVRDLPLLAETPVESYTWIRLGTAVAGSLFLLALMVYAVPILVLYNVSARLALKNGLVLAVKYAGNTAGLLAMAVLLAWLAFRVSAFLFIVLIPAWLVFLVNNTRMVLDIELGTRDESGGSSPPGVG